MKKTFLFFAALGMSLMASATTYEVSATTPNESDNIRRAIRDKAADGDTILLVDAEYTEANSITLDKAGLVIMPAQGVKPVVKCGTYMKLYASTKIEGITFDGGGTAEHGVYNYDNASIRLEIENCVFANYTKYGITGSEAAHMDSLVINNSIFHHMGRSAVYIPHGSSQEYVPCSYFSMTNSTVYNVGPYSGTAAIDVREGATYSQNNVEFVVDHVTLYNFNNSDNGGIMSYKSTNAKVTNCVIANPLTLSEYYPTYNYGGDVKYCLTYHTKAHHNASDLNKEGNIEGEDPLFVDPVNGDFNFTAESPLVGAASDGGNIGDPRWGVAQAQMTFTFLAPATNVEAMNNYTVQFAAVNPYDAATLTLQSSADAKANWDTIYSAAYTDQNAFDWAIRALEPGTYYLRAILAATEKTVIDTCAYTVTIVKDTRAPRAVADLAGSYESETMTLTWTDPIRDIPFGIPFDNENAVSASTKESEATATVAEEGDAVKVDFEVNTAWEYAGAKFACDLNNMTGALTFSLKSEATATMQVMVEQNGYDWWYADVNLDKADFAPVTINFADWKKITWHTKSTADAFDGNNVTAIYIWVTYNPSASGTFYFKDVEFAGAIPASEHFEKTILVRADDEADATLEKGTVIYEGTAETCVDDVDFVSTQTYYYAAFAVDDLGNAAEAATYKYEGGQTTSLNQLQQIDHMAKFFHNGRLMMLKNGKMYDVLGVSVN